MIDLVAVIISILRCAQTARARAEGDGLRPGFSGEVEAQFHWRAPQCIVLSAGETLAIFTNYLLSYSEGNGREGYAFLGFPKSIFVVPAPEVIRKKLCTLSHKPGVYLMKDRFGWVTFFSRVRFTA